MENRNSTGLAREQQLATTAWRGLCMGLGYFLVWMGPWIIIKNAYSMCITLIHYTAEKLSYFILLFRRCVSHTYTGCCLWNCNWFEIQIKFKKFFPVSFLFMPIVRIETLRHISTLGPNWLSVLYLPFLTAPGHKHSKTCTSSICL